MMKCDFLGKNADLIAKRLEKMGYTLGGLHVFTLKYKVKSCEVFGKPTGAWLVLYGVYGL